MPDPLAIPVGLGPPPGREETRPERWSRRIRALTGVDEDLLAWVWHERAKYTALGGVVLGTSVIAAFSMWNFANQATGRASALSLVPAAVWMLFVLSLDRWLIAPQAGPGRRAAPLLMRLLVAVIMGAVVAEPLVLRIFQTAVEQHVADERDTTVDALRSNLLRCNPDPSQPVPGERQEGCARYLLSFASTPAGRAAELSALRRDADVLRKRVDRDTRRLTALDRDSTNACARSFFNTFTGRWEKTARCHRLEAAAADYRRTHRTAGHERRLADMNDRISRITGRLSASRTDFLRDRDTAVAHRVAREKKKQQGIGFAERIRALEALTRNNPALLGGVWMVRLLFVLIDVLPVLVKFLGGASSYDRLLSTRSGSALRIHENAVRTVERLALAHAGIEREEQEQSLRQRKAVLDAEHREHVAAMNIRADRAVNDLEERMRQSSLV